jgi:hypothetical protein
MKNIFWLLLTGASPASAQNPPATDRHNNNALNTQGVNNSSTPVAGANSFTEGQAKSKIEDAGHTDVTSLKKDDAECGAAKPARAAR